jgi:glycosyltransferase involved in cell wall biosynthesis
MARSMTVAMVGTRGIPARYGGFETAVEEIGSRLASRGHRVIVYCRKTDARQQLSEYRGMTLVHLPAVRGKVVETLSHTALSVIHPTLRQADACFLFNAANAPLLPVLRLLRIPTAVHVDGLEWKRSKWSGLGKHYYKLCERLAVRWAQELIADAVGIQEYYRAAHDVETNYIAYGAPILAEQPLERLKDVGLLLGSYHLVVSRLEPENHVREILKGYIASSSHQSLVVVGDAPYAREYVSELHALAATDSRVTMMGSVWDQELLDVLYSGALTYWHGHSVGGTNPSLLRALGAAAPVAAYDVNFNREVAGDDGLYWTTPEDIGRVIAEVETDPDWARERGAEGQVSVAKRYDWDLVTDDYERLAAKLVKGERTSVAVDQRTSLQ